MLSAVAIVGRPNVGKSTLFNQLTRSRDALVADYPGLTRDRRYGYAEVDDTTFVVVDTGGLDDDASELARRAERQTELAIAETDAIVFVVDYRDGLTAADERIAMTLRAAGKPVVLAVNKSEGVDTDVASAEFYRLGFGEPMSIAALHGRGVTALGRALVERLPAAEELPAPLDRDESTPTVAVIGRPNVGKSTLINRLIGSERMITSAEPGTTRDSVHVECERAGKRYVLIDTAGIRRRARVSDTVEKFSVVQSLQAIENAGVVILLLDAREGITEQDLHLLGLVLERGKALTIGVNKWDHLTVAQRRQVESQVERKLQFASFARVSYVSALHGSKIDTLLDDAMRAWEAAGRAFTTPRLNEILERAVAAHPPPIVAGRRLKLRYAHQGGRYPPIIVIHGGRAERIPQQYRRYLTNAYRDALGLVGTPLRLEFRSGENPYEGRRNTLTRRQQKRRQRVIRHRR
jgi:GTP-binding protein